MTESNKIELKGQLTPELEKEVVAFLNAKGGHIYIGINDNGSVVGVEKADEVQLKIKDRLISNIRPSILGLFEISIEEKDEKNIIVIGLASGVEPPYYIKQKGRSEAGCFLRIGSSAQPMTEEMIEQLLSKRLPVSIANIPARNQNLKFTQLEIYYRGKDKQLNKHFANNLKFLTSDGKFNEIAYLFADENRISIRFAKWLGKQRIDLLQNEEYGDTCIVTAMNRVLNRFDAENITQAKKTNRGRIETKYVDTKALKEAIINAILCKGLHNTIYVKPLFM
jgi:predicted HTH transcriptional regulator